jgi:protoporphyrinogen oxidase
MPKVVVIGSGPAGLGAAEAALDLGLDVTVLESQELPGGHCKSFRLNDIVFDEGPHICFSSHDSIREKFSKSAGYNVVAHNPKMLNYWESHWIPHPIQSVLKYVPDPLRTQIVDGFKARPESFTSDNYRQWLEGHLGREFTDAFSERYTQKYWTTSSRNLTSHWVGDRVARPALAEVLRGADPVNPDNITHYFQSFLYPRENGFQNFLQSSIDRVRDNLKTGCRVTSVDLTKKSVVCANGKSFSFDLLVSSMPLDQFIPVLSGAPDTVRRSAHELNCSSVSLHSFVYRAHRPAPAHWIYIYDEDIPVSRIYFPQVFMGRDNDSLQALQAEVYSSRYLPRDPHTDNMDFIIKGLEKLDLLKKSNILAYEHRSIKHANVIFDLARDDNLERIRSYLKDQPIKTVGRYGSWEYLWSDQSYLDGQRAVLEEFSPRCQ